MLFIIHHLLCIFTPQKLKTNIQAKMGVVVVFKLLLCMFLLVLLQVGPLKKDMC